MSWFNSLRKDFWGKEREKCVIMVCLLAGNRESKNNLDGKISIKDFCKFMRVGKVFVVSWKVETLEKQIKYFILNLWKTKSF